MRGRGEHILDWRRVSRRLTVGLQAAACAALMLPSGRATAGPSAPMTSRVTVIHAGTLLIDARESPRRAQTLVVENRRIAAVRDGYIEIPGAHMVDLRQSFVLPGLIDLHVHLTTNPVPGGDLASVTQTGADLALIAADNARRTLAAGFTTVLDLGTGQKIHEEAIYALRDAVASGLVEGPRILAVGSPLSTPANSRTGRFRPEVEAVAGPEAVCSGADDCRRVVREQVRRGADVINIYHTGGLLTEPSPAQTFTDEELGAIVATARGLGRKTIADGGNTRGNAAGTKAALRAGVDIVDTGTYLDAETWRLVKAKGAFFVPHLYALQAAVGDTPETLQAGTMGWLPPPVLESLFRLKQEQPSAVAAHRAGVRLAFGSDPGVFPHGDNAREFIEYVAVVGLTPTEAIATATVNAAEALGMATEIGMLRPGFAADLIATDTSPLDDIGALGRVRLVMRAGKEYKGPSGPP